jgi:hypothetical protein
MKIKYRGTIYEDFILNYIGGVISTVTIIRATKGDIHTSPSKVKIIK